ncbi:Uncharacterised protein [Bordetella pertussis]|nr:Uncharacterised protein [Bordetella pertussis]
MGGGIGLHAFDETLDLRVQGIWQRGGGQRGVLSAVSDADILGRRRAPYWRGRAK